MAASGPRHWEQDKEATVYIGNLDERATDELVWELMLQVGRVQNVHLPKDRVTQTHQGFGFVEFKSEEDADYAAKVMNQIKLFGKPIRVNKASADKQKTVEIGAELFIGNLNHMVDERQLYDTFSRFGPLVAIPKVARHEDGMSKGYGFVSYADFESSDAAIANMNGQYLMNQEISVQYAYKKDGKGERHGDPAERLLAKQAKEHGVTPVIQGIPPAMFDAPVPPSPGMMNGTGGGMTGAPTGPAGFGAGYNNAAPPRAPPASLPPPPTGLPARPPASTAGLNGPVGYAPPAGFNTPTPPPVPGFGPPSGAPPAGAAPSGVPPSGVPPPGTPGYRM